MVNTKSLRPSILTKSHFERKKKVHQAPTVSPYQLELTLLQLSWEHIDIYIYIYTIPLVSLSCKSCFIPLTVKGTATINHQQAPGTPVTPGLRLDVPAQVAKVQLESALRDECRRRVRGETAWVFHICWVYGRYNCSYLWYDPYKWIC